MDTLSADAATIPAKSEKMHKLIESSRLVVIPNAGHMTPVEAPEAVNTALEEFLSEVG